jgi:folate-binding protein YgfZ
VLGFPGAVATPPGSPDEGVAWHYGDPFGEQRAAATRVAVVDRSHRFVIAITGPERLTWLHTICSQHVENLADGEAAESLDLDLNGRVLHHFVLTDIAARTAEPAPSLWLDTEPAGGPTLLDYLVKMVFWAKVAPRDATAELAVLTLLGPAIATVLPALGIPEPPPIYRAVALPDGGFVRTMPPLGATPVVDVVTPRQSLTQRWETLVSAGARPAGVWAYEALRVAAHRPRAGVDTDDRTIPHEVGWIGSPTDHGAVHLNKGCYRGQETVARVHNLGKPPRHLVLLQLDGSGDERPSPGDPVTADGRAVGVLGTTVDHFEQGPIALALIKRTVPATTPLVAGGVAAAIDPDSVPSHDEPQAGRQAVERLRHGN